MLILRAIRAVLYAIEWLLSGGRMPEYEVVL